VTTVVAALAHHLAWDRGRRVGPIDATGGDGQRLRRLLEEGEATSEVASKEGDHGLEVVSWPATDGGHGDGSPQATVERLGSSFDVLIVDAGSLRNTVALRWARCAGAVLLIVDGNRTTAEAPHRLGEELHHARIEISGVVLNKRRYWVPGVLYRYLY
jgi:Mrp family chromosome partitioning ATPase